MGIKIWATSISSGSPLATGAERGALPPFIARVFSEMKLSISASEILIFPSTSRSRYRERITSSRNSCLYLSKVLPEAITLDLNSATLILFFSAIS